MGYDERYGRWKLASWRRALPLAVALGLVLPVVALVRVTGFVPLELDWALELAPIPDGGWAGAWSEHATTATAMRAEAFDAALRFLVGLSLVVWSGALLLGVLGALRRVAAERAEWLLRSAMGATHGQLKRDLLHRGLRSAGVAVAFGMVLAAAVLELGVRLRPAGILVTNGAGASLLFGASTGALLLVTALALTALPPMLLPAARALRRPERAASRALRHDLIWLLAAGQVAGCLAIAATAVMLADSGPVQGHGARAYPHARDTLVLRVELPEDAHSALSWPRIRQAVEQLPEVSVASVTSPGGILGLGTVDRTGAVCSTCRAAGLGVPVTFALARHVAVDGGFFDVLGIADRPALDEGGVLLGSHMAHTLFQSERAVGQRVAVRGATPLEGRTRGVDGVVSGGVPAPAGLWPWGGGAGAVPNIVLVPIAWASPREADVLLRYSGAGRGGVESAAARVVTRVVPGARVSAVGRLDQVLAEEAEPLGRIAGMIAGLSAAALLFAVFGFAGAMAERVRARGSEIGLRRAVGATRTRILRLAFADAGLLALPGVVLGVALAASISRGIGSVLGGVEPLGAGELAGLAIAAVGVALASSVGAAARAVRTDPVTAIHD